MIYQKYIEQFDKIGYSEDRIVVVPNFINKKNLDLVNAWLSESKTEGGIDRNDINNEVVVNILLDSENKIYDQIHNLISVECYTLAVDSI
jgi:hypothetical protein